MILVGRRENEEDSGYTHIHTEVPPSQWDARKMLGNSQWQSSSDAPLSNQDTGCYKYVYVRWTLGAVSRSAYFEIFAFRILKFLS